MQEASSQCPCSAEAGEIYILLQASKPGGSSSIIASEGSGCHPHCRPYSHVELSSRPRQDRVDTLYC
jgi:hypothetical protein